jgi:predicted ABC-type transport system involved in lysophospholipase L1 biosynthesis ATPase subunit
MFSSPAAAARASLVRRILVADNAARKRLVAGHPEAVLISARLPLRANLSVLENIAIVPRLRDGRDAAAAADYAWNLLGCVGYTRIADLRDPDLGHEERFIAKLVRAVVLGPPIILIDRPGRLLPDTYYPPFVDATLAALHGRFEQCWIVDYEWNAPLYPRPESGA